MTCDKTDSTTTPSGLLPAHERILEQRAIPIAFALEHGVVSLTDVEWARWKEYHVGPPRLPYHEGCTGLLITYTACSDYRDTKRCRVRLDQESRTVQEEPGSRSHCCHEVKLPRYIAQAGLAVAPYLIDEVLKVAGDTSVPLHVVEAPLKALALSAHGLPAIGLGGVLAGAHDKEALAALDEIVAHAELKRLKWSGRRTYIVFDAGVANADEHEGNPMVALGAARVWRALSDLGADVRLVTIPYYHPQDSKPEDGSLWWEGKDQGPDDYLARNGLDALKERIEAALPADPKCRVEAALSNLTGAQRAGAIDVLLSDLFFMATLAAASAAKLAAVAALTKGAGVGIRDLKAAVTEFNERVARRHRVETPAWTRL